MGEVYSWGPLEGLRADEMDCRNKSGNDNYSWDDGDFFDLKEDPHWRVFLNDDRRLEAGFFYLCGPF